MHAPHAADIDCLASTGSLWQERGLISTAPLTKNIAADVCVVGAGIAGLLVAERLVNEFGMNVVVLDAGPLTGGETSRTTAHFAIPDDRFMHLEKLHGEKGAQLAMQSHMAATDYVESLVQRLNIDCQWQRLDGYLAVNEHHTQERDELLRDEMEACRRLGGSVDLVESLPPPWPSSLGRVLRFSRQGQLHPIDMLNGVIAALRARGLGMYTGTRAVEIHGGPSASVETEHGPVVSCRHVIVATNTPVNNLVAMHTKQNGYQTYVVALRVPRGVLPPLLLWDGLWENDRSYHYVRLAKGSGDHELLLVGGEDHKTGQGPDGDEPYRCLESWARKNFPMAGEAEFRWSGEVMEPADGLGYIGHNAVGRQNVYIVTGDSGNGMTHGAIAAMLIPDLIMGREHPWKDLYDPARKIGWHSLGDYAAENLNTIAQYRDWLTRGDVQDESEIKPGCGAVMVKGMRRLAVYKDEQGVCTRVSATCTHLGGVVRWNPLEKTWDCPCHASRFAKDGSVIHGPANSPLTPERDL